MVLQPHSHGNSGFPFCVNGFCTSGLEASFNIQEHQEDAPNIQFADSNLSHSANLAFQFEKQWEEMDQFIKNMYDQLRLMMYQEKQQVAILLKNAESQTLQMVLKKDREIAQAVKKRLELEEFIRRLEADNWEWKRLAREKEAAVSALHKTLREEKERREKVVINDVESCCDENEKTEEEQPTWEMKEACKRCYSRRSCCLFLPCRHVASCKLCEAYLQACPICGMLKKASIEALFF